MSMKPLIKVSQDALLHQLGKDTISIKSIFSCGGSVALKPNQLCLFYQTADNAQTSKKAQSSKKVQNPKQAQVLEFPCIDEHLEPLLKTCTPATFGHGKKTVLDPSYRDALHLATDSFSLNFHPVQYGILEEIRKYMTPNHAVILPELYKLNVYGPGGHFKAHVDTPRGKGMFGSLVVCLPTKHQGGQLVVRHDRTQNVFDWSSDPSKSGATADAENSDLGVHWAAFFADCEHEIFPIKSGYRITLTYNLYSLTEDTKDTQTTSGFQPESLPLYKTLSEAIAYPGFMPNGGTLGFGLRHAYPLTTGEFQCQYQTMLKGCDATLCTVAEELGLDVEVVPVFETEDYNGISQRLIGDTFTRDRGRDMEEDRSEFNIIEEDWGGTQRKDIIWCVEPENSVVANTYIAYGNEATLEEIYVMGGLLITIPAWGKKCRAAK